LGDRVAPDYAAVHFRIATLLIRLGELARALDVYKVTVRDANEKDLILRAGRGAIGIAEHTHTLSELEPFLRRLGHERKLPVFTRLISELQSRTTK